MQITPLAIASEEERGKLETTLDVFGVEPLAGGKNG
jgi:hypothetical protein